MSHMVESLAYAGEVPWHGLGAKLATNLSASDMLRVAGLDWTVVERPVYAAPFDGPIPGVKALVRDPHGNVLKVVGNDYGVIQNRIIADLAEAMAGAGVKAWEVAGCLDEGRRVFFCGQVGETEIAGDVIRQYLTLASSHDTTLSLTGIRTPVRVVCANTLGMALADGGATRISIRHTKNAEAKVKLAVKLVEDARAYFGSFNDQALAMVGATLSVIEAAEMADALFPAYRSEDTAEMVTPRLRDVVLGLFKGQAYVPAERRIAGTRWGFYQAVTAALDHNRPGADRTRLGRYLSGGDETLRTKAWRLLTGKK